MAVLAMVGLSCAAADAAIISLNPKATYLRKYSGDGAPNATAYALADYGIAAGDTIKLTRLGDFQGASTGTDTRVDLVAVFSGSTTLLAANVTDRVADAIDAGMPEWNTPNTAVAGDSTNIPEDFYVDGSPGVDVVVPTGALYLFFTASDSYFNDNTDPDVDYGVEITLVSAAIPEPASAVVGLAGLGVLSCAGRRRCRG